MEFKKLTKEQYQDLLNERVQFEYYDGDYFYVLATLDNDTKENDGLPYRLRICLSENEDDAMTFFNNDRLKELLKYSTLVDVTILKNKETEAITNYNQKRTPEQEYLKKFDGEEIESLDEALSAKGFRLLIKEKHRIVWTNESIKKVVVGSLIGNIIATTWAYDGFYDTDLDEL